MDSLKELLLYASTVSNEYNFIGHKDFGNGFEFYRSVIGVASEAHRDFMEFKVTSLEIEDPYDLLKASIGGTIFITFHSGSYNMLCAHLLSKGEKTCMLSDTSSMLMNDYQIVSSLYRQHFNNNGDCEMLNVQEEGFIFRLINKIRKSYPILAFIDGNKGIDGLTKENENLIDINFLKGVVKVRKGLPYVAYITDRPIVLAIAYKDGGKNYLRLHEPIRKNEREDRETFCKRCLEYIFGTFGNHLKKYSEQWASWPYLHSWANLTAWQNRFVSDKVGSQIDVQRLVFNSDRFLPLKLHEEFMLFDKMTYSAIKIEPNDAPLFSHKTSLSEKIKMLENLAAGESSKIEQYVSKSILVEA